MKISFFSLIGVVNKEVRIEVDYESVPQPRDQFLDKIIHVFKEKGSYCASATNWKMVINMRHIDYIKVTDLPTAPPTAAPKETPSVNLTLEIFGLANSETIKVPESGDDLSGRIARAIMDNGVLTFSDGAHTTLVVRASQITHASIT